MAPPWAPWCPPDPWYVILSHSQSSWVVFDPSGVSNWGVSLLCIAVQCSAILCFFAFLRFFCVFWCFWIFFCMIWSYIIIFRPAGHRKHHLNPKWGDLISSHFMYAFRDISTYSISILIFAASVMEIAIRNMTEQLREKYMWKSCLADVPKLGEEGPQIGGGWSGGSCEIMCEENCYQIGTDV